MKGCARLWSSVLVGLGCNFGSPGGNAVQGTSPAVDETTADGSGGVGTGFGTGPGADSEATSDSTSASPSDSTSTPATTADDASTSVGPDSTSTGAIVGDGSSTTDGSPVGTTAELAGALIEVADAPTFDFGDVSLGMSAEHDVMLTNVGDVSATALTMGGLPAPFSYAGTGTCQGMLEPGDTCTVVVVFGPGAIGLASAEMIVQWGGGDESSTSLALRGGGAGSTLNLLQNPGAETSGNPPPSWTEVAGADWQTADWITAHGGARALFAGGGPLDQLQFALGQAVGVASWASTIDAGALRVTGSAWQLAGAGVDNNISRVRLSFADSNGVAISTLDSPVYGGMAWQEAVLDTVVPPQTRSISLVLQCAKTAGESACDAYFDDASLVVSYP